MQAVSQVDGEITRIPSNMEEYISFSLIKHKKTENKKKPSTKKTKNKTVKGGSFRQDLLFVGSAQFMLPSLYKLVNVTPNENMEITATYETYPEKRALLIRNGV